MLAFLRRLEMGHPFVPAGELDAESLAALRAALVLREDEPGREDISLPDLVRLVRKLFGVEPRGLTIGVPAPLGLRDSILVGYQSTPEGDREVVLVLQPRYGLQGVVLGRPRRTLVVIPTGEVLKEKERKLHGAKAFVEILTLEATIAVKGGRVVRKAENGAVVAVAVNDHVHDHDHVSDDESGERKKAPLIPGATDWSHVRIARINGLTVRIDVPGQSYRRTHVDLGMASAKNREPTRAWEMLLAICDGHGDFKWRIFGHFPAAKKLVSRLRVHLKDIFGIPSSPFHKWSFRLGWRAKFRALPELPGENEPPLVPRKKRAEASETVR